MDGLMICPEAVSTAHLDSLRQIVAAQRERVGLGLKDLDHVIVLQRSRPRDSRPIPALG